MKKYSKEQILKLLKGYVKMNVTEIPIGVHVRYFITDKDKNTNKPIIGADGHPKRIFRRGGFIKSKNIISSEPYPKGIIYMSNEPIGKVGVNWRISLDKYTTFFRKPSVQMYQSKMQEVVSKKNNEIKRLKVMIRKLDNDYQILFTKYHSLKSKYKKIKNTNSAQN